MKEVSIKALITNKKEFESDLLNLLKKYGLKHEKVAIKYVRIECSLDTIPEIETTMQVLED